VLGGKGNGRRHAWSVLTRSGMAAWAAAVALISTPRRDPAPEPDRTTTAVLPDGGRCAHLVDVLAALVMAAAPGASAPMVLNSDGGRRLWIGT
jgi:hypothetical protein